MQPRRRKFSWQPRPRLGYAAPERGGAGHTHGTNFRPNGPEKHRGVTAWNAVDGTHTEGGCDMATRLTIALGVFAFVSSGTAHAVTLNQGAAACQAAVGRGLRGFKKAYVKAWEKCLDGDLKGKGCDAAKRDTVIAIAMTKANATVTGTCTDALLFDAAPNGAGFAMDCHLEG